MATDRNIIIEALKPDTHYIIDVSHNESDPIHKAIFFHSADGKGTVYTLGYEKPIEADYQNIYYILIRQEFYLEEVSYEN